ncbi:AlbA family DNA-binding domain-containing protein [Nocardia gipuzkoensis]
MQNFPRLTAVFGTPVTSLAVEAIDRAIMQQVPEAVDLDWKQTLYPDNTKGKEEFCKDVAGFANAYGGILVLGVGESPDSRASQACYVPLSKGETDRMRQLCRDQIRPYLPGVEVRAIEKQSDLGYYVIIVPRSAMAPHAVVKGGNGTVLSYPLRAGVTTRWLHEGEIAVCYRDRFVSQSERAAALDRVHGEGIMRLPSRYPWITVSTYPAIPGQYGVGSTAVASVQGLMHSWTRHTAPPIATFPSDTKAVPGVRRLILNPDVGITASSSPPHAQLHFNGAGFTALSASTTDRSADNPLVDNADKLTQDTLELQLLALISLLAHHAAQSGSAGECELQAQLVLATKTDRPELYPAPSVVFQPVSPAPGMPFDDYEPVPHPVIVRKNAVPTKITASLDELSADAAAIVRAAYALACDILGEFGIADPCVLRPDGQLNTERIVNHRTDVADWATRHLGHN